jgi:RND superfamily putative drug exporter
VLLLLIYRSPVLWLLPMLAVTGGLFTAQAAITLLARAGALTVTDLSAGILNVLVFGAATDYALLLIARYRDELHTTSDHRQALAAAVRAATPAIAASGATVIAAMLCLLAATINSNRGLGPVAALGIAGGLLASLTLLPALLAVTGRRVFWPRTPHTDAAAGNVAGTAGHLAAPKPSSGMWVGLGTLIARRPRLVWVLTALVLAAGSVGLVDARLGLPQDGAFRGAAPTVVGQRLLDAHFPPGASAPALILTDTTASGAVQRAATATPGVVAVTPAERSGSRTLLRATLADEPDSAAAEQSVTALRDRLAGVPGARALVGGTTAVRLDSARGAAHDRAVVMPLVLAVVLLVLLLRAVVAPLVLLATVVLSYAAALGVSVALFRALGLAGTDPSVPLYAFLFLVALGVDYNIFLMTRIREETLQHGTRAGTLRGLALTGGVITSAGLVLAATFTTLTVLPLVVLTETGLAVALGVLLDTLLVRSLLVPALTLDLGRRTWWPSHPQPARAQLAQDSKPREHARSQANVPLTDRQRDAVPLGVLTTEVGDADVLGMRKTSGWGGGCLTARTTPRRSSCPTLMLR